MLTSRAARLYTFVVAFALCVCAATPARAQYKPQPLNDPATGEKFHIEAAAGLWFPSADMTVTVPGSGPLTGILGTSIDLKKDFGLTDQHFPQVQIVLRPARGQKLRFQYIPIKYDQSATLTRTIAFAGQQYTFGLPVNSSLDWKAYRFAYEYDFVVKNRGFAGFLVEAKYTDVQVSAASPLRSDFAHASAPIPALGGIGRVYIVPNISITGELSGFKLPDSIDKRYGAHYIDLDIYGTVNFTNNIGAQLGYRSFDVYYLVKSDTGSLTLKGMYFGGVVRY